MKIPKTIKRHCPFCKKHTKHSVDRVKTSGRRPGSALKAGSRYRTIKLHKGYGGSPYPMIEHGKKYGAKSSQKLMLKYTCSECKKKHQSGSSKRIKKFEIAK